MNFYSSSWELESKKTAWIFVAVKKSCGHPLHVFIVILLGGRGLLVIWGIWIWPFQFGKKRENQGDFLGLQAASQPTTDWVGFHPTIGEACEEVVHLDDPNKVFDDDLFRWFFRYLRVPTKQTSYGVYVYMGPYLLQRLPLMNILYNKFRGSSESCKSHRKATLNIFFTTWNQNSETMFRKKKPFSKNHRRKTPWTLEIFGASKAGAPKNVSVKSLAPKWPEKKVVSLG